MGDRRALAAVLVLGGERDDVRSVVVGRENDRRAGAARERTSVLVHAPRVRKPGRGIDGARVRRRSGEQNGPNRKLRSSLSPLPCADAAATAGAALVTCTVAVYSVTPPSLSLILPLTMRVPLSVGVKLALLAAPKAP